MFCRSPVATVQLAFVMNVVSTPRLHWSASKKASLLFGCRMGSVARSQAGFQVCGLAPSLLL